MVQNNDKTQENRHPPPPHLKAPGMTVINAIKIVKKGNDV